jgi:hypothetical protein
LVVPLLNPEAILAAPEQAGAELGRPVRLALGGRGIRNLEFVPADRSYLVLAGPVGDAGGFALHAWSGRTDDERPAEVAGARQVFARLPADFRPEAMVVEAEGRRVVLVSDDGGRTLQGQDCKDLPRVQQRFRSVVLQLG